MEPDIPLKSFTNLRTWQEAHKLVLQIYKCAKQFPPQEQFILGAQLQRAAISITSNIAEGFSRNSPKEKAQFYHIALGSLTECQNQLLLARDIGYIDNDELQVIGENTVIVSKMLNGLIKTTKMLKT